VCFLSSVRLENTFILFYLSGADDDGTGTVNLIEVFRVLMTNAFEPSTPVEFHWYSGEEGGLLGSQAIAKSYDQAGVQVKSYVSLLSSHTNKVG
jgi:bacterial leucyl aminopeptidase